MRKTIMRFIYTIGTIGIITGVLLIAYVAYMTLYPIEVIRLKEFHTNSSEVKKGEYLEYTLDIENILNIKPEVEWYLVDGIVYKLNATPDHDSSIYIPNSAALPPEEYRLKVTLKYDIFPLRNPIEYSFTSNSFKIKDQDD